MRRRDPRSAGKEQVVSTFLLPCTQGRTHLPQERAHQSSKLAVDEGDGPDVGLAGAFAGELDDVRSELWGDRP